jgi:hypothetical protein
MSVVNDIQIEERLELGHQRTETSHSPSFRNDEWQVLVLKPYSGPGSAMIPAGSILSEQISVA